MKNNSTKIILFCVGWIVILGLLTATYKLAIEPMMAAKEKKEQDIKHQNVILETSADSHYKTQIAFGIDSFSGYAVFRSKEFQTETNRKGIKINLLNDNADYKARLENLKSGRLQMGVFTIDALIKMSAEINDLPAAIVAIVDETRGADAIVAYKEAVPDIDTLNDLDTKFVLTPDSPSETLSRVVISHFGLHNLKDPFVPAKDAEEVFQKFRKADHKLKQVYVLWEPYVSKVLENPNTHILVDTSRFRGYVVDVIVCNREYLKQNGDQVKAVVQAYFSAFYKYKTKPEGFRDLILNDAKATELLLTDQQADRLINGIWWKNTQENYEHFGVGPNTHLQHIEDMLNNITQVLLSTNAIKADPTNGRPAMHYWPDIMKDSYASNYHPGITAETVRDDNAVLAVLSEEEWNKLTPVGTLDVPRIIFARGTDSLTDGSKSALDELIQKLNTWPQYYIKVRGNVSTRGDLEANTALAMTRATIVRQYLLDHGIAETRIKALTGEPESSPTVTFQLGYTPY